jgi:prepilin-type N-terminal cleavage/methylation domain-containing protein
MNTLRSRSHAAAAPAGNRAGYSLIELLVAVTIMALVFGLLSLTGSANSAAFKSGISEAHLESQIGSALAHVTSELRIAGKSTLEPQLAPGASTDSLQFAEALDLHNGQIVWSAPRRLAFEYAPKESNDGVDNNGNGLVDEGRLVLTLDVGTPQERRVVLTNWVPELLEGELPNGIDDNHNGLVDERGFCIERVADASGDALLVHLSLQRRDANGRTLTKTIQVKVRVRN